MKQFIKSVLSSTKQTIDATNEMYRATMSPKRDEETMISEGIFSVYCILTGSKLERVVGLSNLGLLVLCKASGNPMVLPRLYVDAIQMTLLAKRDGVYNTTLVSLAAVGTARILTDKNLGPKPEFSVKDFDMELDKLKETIQAEEAYTRTLSDDEVEGLRKEFPEIFNQYL